MSGRNVRISTGLALSNYGFILADDALEIKAGDAVQNQREKLVEYSVSYDAGTAPYAPLYQKWLATYPTSDWHYSYASAVLQNIEHFATFVDEDVAKGGSITGTTINLAAATDVMNYGSVIASTGDLSITAGGKVWDTYVLLHKSAQNGESAHKEFYGTEILSGGNLTLTAGGDFSNQASILAAYGDITINVKGAVTNYLTADK